MMDYVLFKGRPLTRAILQDINAFFALVQKDKPIPKQLKMRLEDADVQKPFMLPSKR